MRGLKRTFPMRDLKKPTLMRARDKDRTLMGAPNENHIMGSLVPRILMEAEGLVRIAKASSQLLPPNLPKPNGALTEPKGS
jgi:hypothetical protein